MSESRNLTAKQERFTLLVASGKGLTEAYRDCYSTENMKSSSVHRNAKALMDNTKISSRISEIRASAIAKSKVDLETLIIELKNAINIAKEHKQPTAIVAAVRELGRLHDLYPKPTSSSQIEIHDLSLRILKGRAKYQNQKEEYS